MAKDQSFDIVSEVDMQEVDNAYGQARKELAQRYDLKGSGAKLEFERKSGAVTITAPSDFVCKQVRDILETRLIRRKVDMKDKVEDFINDPQNVSRRIMWETWRGVAKI